MAKLRPTTTIVFSLIATILVFPIAGISTIKTISADEGNAIDVCCAWNDKLADGELSYKISGGDEAAQQAVRNAVEEWEASGITLTEVSGKTKPDIDVKFKRGGGMIAGQALRSYDSAGFIDGVRISISGSAFGSANNVDTVEQITKHEMGHALGLGHANFDGDLMSTTVQAGIGTISACDINGVVEANHWKLADGSSSPHQPHVNHVHC